MEGRREGIDYRKVSQMVEERATLVVVAWDEEWRREGEGGGGGGWGGGRGRGTKVEGKRGDD